MTVLTFGVFDYFHYGHLKLLERCKNLGDVLTVAVQADEEIHKTKPNAIILYSLSQRMEMISALKCVDNVVPYTQMDVTIKTLNFDILVVGPDQNHSGILRAIEWAKSQGKEVVTLPRTPGISSTEIRERILNKWALIIFLFLI